MSVSKGPNPVVPRDPVGQRRPFLVLAILIVGIVGGAMLWQMRPREDENQDQRRLTNSGGFLSKSGAPGAVRSPRIRWAAEVTLPDDTDIVGVIVAEKPRAYHLGVFRPPNFCVVNDLINDIPITVTYNESDNKVGVYTDRFRGSPLEFVNGGNTPTDGKGGTMKMLLNIENVSYFQDSGEPVDKSNPKIKKLAKHPFERMSWKEWKEAHPNTEIYTRTFGLE